MKVIYIVTSDNYVEIATVNKNDAINTFKHCLETEGIEFDMLSPNARIRMFSNVCRIDYTFNDKDNVKHTIKIHTEYLEGID